VHGRATYNKVVEAVNKACAEINSRTTSSDDSQLCFVITQEKDMVMLQLKFPNTQKGPQILY
jgi:hypothetical protein